MKKILRFLLIRENEAFRVLFLLSFFFILGSGLTIGRATADALFLKRYGIEYLPYMYFILSVLLSNFSLAYAAFADRISSERFFIIIFSSLGILIGGIWYFVTQTNFTTVYPVYFLVYEVASELLIIHAALYISQNLDTLQAKRLTPVIMAGSQVGTICGGVLLALIAPKVGIENLLLLWCTLISSAIIMLFGWHKLFGGSPYFHSKPKARNRIKQSFAEIYQGYRFTRESELLKAASFALFFMVIAFYILYYSVNKFYTEHYETEAELTAFYGLLTAAISVIGLVLQLLVSNRVIERFGIRKINLIFPITTAISYLSLIFHFALPSALFGSFNKDAIMPAFRNPVHTLFFNILPTYIQGRARAMSIAVVLPLALFFCGGILLLMQQLNSTRYLLIPGLIATLLYIWFNIKMNKAYVGTLVKHLKEQLFLPDDRFLSTLKGSGNDVFQTLLKGISQKDEQLTLTYSKTLIEAFPKKAGNVILEKINSSSPATANQLIKLLIPLNPPHFRQSLLDQLKTDDHHLYSTILQTLFSSHDKETRPLAKAALGNPNPRICVTGIYGVFTHPLVDLIPKACEIWRNLLSNTGNERIAAFDLLSIIEKLPEKYHDEFYKKYADIAVELLSNEDTQYRILLTLSELKNFHIHDLSHSISKLLEHTDPKIRIAAVRCLHLLPEKNRHALFEIAFEDGFARVRHAAFDLLLKDHPDHVQLAEDFLITHNIGSPRAQQSLLEKLNQKKLPNLMLTAISENKAIDAKNIRNALESLTSTRGDEDKKTELLRLVLRERLKQLCELSLVALQRIEDPAIIGVIRAGLNSSEQRHIANACEALSSLKNKNIANLLLFAIDNIDTANSYRLMHPTPLQDTLNWCHQRSDNWLQKIAQYTDNKMKTIQQSSM